MDKGRVNLYAGERPHVVASWDPTRMDEPSTPSSPGLTGRPSIPEAFQIDREAAAYWIARSSRATTVLIVLTGFPLVSCRLRDIAYAARAFGAAGGANTFQSAASCSLGSVSACSFSSVIPGIISSTTRPCGVTSMTARLDRCA